jgi:hypothetical protein
MGAPTLAPCSSCTAVEAVGGLMLWPARAASSMPIWAAACSAAEAARYTGAPSRKITINASVANLHLACGNRCIDACHYVVRPFGHMPALQSAHLSSAHGEDFAPVAARRAVEAS